MSDAPTATYSRMRELFDGCERYKSLAFFARQIVEGYMVGLHRSPLHGFSVEFSEHRPYNNGESTHDIDWKLFGRTDKLFVKQYAEETNLRCQIVIDHSNSMRFPLERHADLAHPNKITFAIYSTAVIIEMLARQRDAFGLTLVSDTIDLQTETRSSKIHQQHLLNILANELSSQESHDTTAVAESLHRLSDQLHRRSLVIIFTDAICDQAEREATFDALRHLRHRGHEVLFFHTLDSEHEADLLFDDRPTLFIDLESGQRVKAQPSAIAEHYRGEMKRQADELRRRAIQYHIDYQAIAVENGADKVLLPFLLKRAKMV